VSTEDVSTADDDVAGSYLTSGAALAGLGLFAIAVALVLKLLRVEMHFIDGQAMAALGGAFFVIGAAMTSYGRSLTKKR